MAKDEEDEDLLPDKDAAKGFYAKYEPKEILGRGISSTVRRCIEKETGKEFAAKIIDLGAATEAGETNPLHMLEATRQEISILRQVMGHPYIIDLQDVFESDAFVFLVFELCPKGELFDYLTSVVTLSEKKTRTIMRQVFEGVEYIHAKTIVHRDLKPENILLDENHNVKITDFGFARQLKDGEKLSDLCGTPGYLAPETLKCNMFEGSPGYSREVDIWACGVIMFTLLVGCPPFWHRKQMVMLRNIMEGKYSFTSPEWADISEDPKDLIRKCLVVDPAQRITVKEALKHPFFNQMLFEQNIDGLKRSLSTKSRRMSRITEIALVLLPEPSLDGRTTTYQLKQQSIRSTALKKSVIPTKPSAAPVAVGAKHQLSLHRQQQLIHTQMCQQNDQQQQQQRHQEDQKQQLPTRNLSNSNQLSCFLGRGSGVASSYSAISCNVYNNNNNNNNNYNNNNINNNNNPYNNSYNSTRVNSSLSWLTPLAPTTITSSTGAHSQISIPAKHKLHQNQRQQQQKQPIPLYVPICYDGRHFGNKYQQQQKYDQDNNIAAHYSTDELRKQSRFNARKKFQFAILVIRAMIRIRRLRYTAEPLRVEEAINDPYRVKVLRKVIDGCAFRVYGHWVKKGEGQNRAALFENTPRTELHALYINNLSR